ncbi:MAG: hypothetical protein U0228_39265 [Myxococcaceae bacterium]
MRKVLMLTGLFTAALGFSGCGGLTPELYELVVDAFTLPDSCYSNGMQPSTQQITEPPGLVSVKVWDGPEATAFLEIESGGGSIDMGAAPNVSLNGVFTGKKVDKGWTFSSDASTKTTAGGNTLTDTTHAEFTFERSGGTFKGTGALSSSRACTGAVCGTNGSPSCSVAGINFRGTRIAVQFERAP